MVREPAARSGCPAEGAEWRHIMEVGGVQFPGLTWEEDGHRDKSKKMSWGMAWGCGSSGKGMPGGAR